MNVLNIHPFIDLPAVSFKTWNGYSNPYYSDVFDVISELTVIYNVTSNANKRCINTIRLKVNRCETGDSSESTCRCYVFTHVKEKRRPYGRQGQFVIVADSFNLAQHRRGKQAIIHTRIHMRDVTFIKRDIYFYTETAMQASVTSANVISLQWRWLRIVSID